MPIDDWMPTLGSKLAEITEIEQVHTYEDLPGAISAFPTVIVLPLEGRFEYSAGGPQNGHHELQVTAYCATQIAPEAYKTAVPLIELVRNKIAANLSLDGLVEHILPSTSGPFYDGPGGVRYAGSQHLGIIFRYVVKENENGTYPVSA